LVREPALPGVGPTPEPTAGGKRTHRQESGANCTSKHFEVFAGAILADCHFATALTPRPLLVLAESPYHGRRAARRSPSSREDHLRESRRAEVLARLTCPTRHPNMTPTRPGKRHPTRNIKPGCCTSSVLATGFACATTARRGFGGCADDSSFFICPLRRKGVES
jgi:hypothetical protein